MNYFINYHDVRNDICDKTTNDSQNHLTQFSKQQQQTTNGYNGIAASQKYTNFAP